mmetsp:Transcript_11086/g.19515  ORF Transcript_11086/g.19515 Transcript_11086/m.19515 type:complete len:357 (+) Transcript_11086:239-1309(+)
MNRMPESDDNNNSSSNIKTNLSPSHGWSPHTAALHRRRKIDGSKRHDLHNSLGALALDEDDDYLLTSSPVKPKSDSKLGLRGKAKPSSGRKLGTSSDDKSKEGSSSTAKKSKSKSMPRTGRSKSPGGLKPSSSTAAAKSKSRSISGGRRPKKNADNDAPKEITSQDDIPLPILEKLATLTDSNTPLKERCQLEVDMMQDPFTKKIMVDFRHNFDRKAFLKCKAQLEQQEQERIQSNILTEAQKEQEFKKQLAAKRQREIEEQIAAAEREAQMINEARKHAYTSIAQGMEQVRKDAEKTVQVASINRLKKKKHRDALEEELKEFRNGEGKNMHEAQRALKEAMIAQKYFEREQAEVM